MKKFLLILFLGPFAIGILVMAGMWAWIAAFGEFSQNNERFDSVMAGAKPEFSVVEIAPFVAELFENLKVRDEENRRHSDRRSEIRTEARSTINTFSAARTLSPEEQRRRANSRNDSEHNAIVSELNEARQAIERKLGPYLNALMQGSFIAETVEQDKFGFVVINGYLPNSGISLSQIIKPTSLLEWNFIDGIKNGSTVGFIGYFEYDDFRDDYRIMVVDGVLDLELSVRNTDAETLTLQHLDALLAEAYKGGEGESASIEGDAPDVQLRNAFRDKVPSVEVVLTQAPRFEGMPEGHVALVTQGEASGIPIEFQVFVQSEAHYRHIQGLQAGATVTVEGLLTLISPEKVVLTAEQDGIFR